LPQGQLTVDWNLQTMSNKSFHFKVDYSLL
jgi:hypothetical protein